MDEIIETITEKEEQQQVFLCVECQQHKQKEHFRKAQNPTVCLTCIGKRKKKRQQISPTVLSATQGKEKERITLFLSPFAQMILTVLSVNRSQSEIVEQALYQQYEEADDITKQFICSMLKRKTTHPID